MYISEASLFEATPQGKNGNYDLLLQTSELNKQIYRTAPVHKFGVFELFYTNQLFLKIQKGMWAQKTLVPSCHT